MKELKNVLRILRRTKELIEADKPYELKGLSDETIHVATISQDPDNIIVAVLVYSLNKIFTRKNYRSMEGWGIFYTSVLKNLNSAIRHLEKEEIGKVRIHLGRIRNSANKISGDLKDYIREVFKKAEINKAFKIYEHGISSEQTAKLLGVSLWDLASYIGQSSIHEAKMGITMPESKRVKIAMEMFE